MKLLWMGTRAGPLSLDIKKIVFLIVLMLSSDAIGDSTITISIEKMQELTLQYYQLMEENEKLRYLYEKETTRLQKRIDKLKSANGLCA